MLDGDTGVTSNVNQKVIFSLKTIKETTIENNIPATISHTLEGTYVPNMDKPKETIKQTLIHQNRKSSLNPSTRKSYSADISAPEYTLKDQLLTDVRNVGLNPLNREGPAIDYNDLPRDTIKQTTAVLSRDGNIKSIVESNYVPHSDKAKNTIKQMDITKQRNYEIGLTNSNQGYYLKNDDMIPEPTLKQQTIYQQDGPVRKQVDNSYSRDENDTARDTIKQTTIYSNHINGLAKTTGNYTRDNQLKARETIKETVLQATPISNLVRTTGSYSKHDGLIAKRTIKEETLSAQPISNIVKTTASYSRDHNLKTKETKRQTTHQETPGGRIGNSNLSSYSKPNDLIARETRKETTLLTNHIGALESTNANKPRVYDDMLNMTICTNREEISRSRAAGPKSDQIGPNRIPMNLRQPLPERDSLNPPSLLKYSQSDVDKIYTRNKKLIANTNYKTNTIFVATLANNPLVNNIIKN